MKIRMLVVMVLLASVVLAACSATAASIPAATGSGAQGSAASQAAVATGMPPASATQSANQGNAETLQALQLALGTLKLDGTAYPIDAEQAASLLLLWKAARSLNNSETTAAQEVAGLVKQIQGTMTAEQLQAIQAMDLSMQNLPAIAQELGLDLGGAGQAGSAAPLAGASAQASGGGQAPPAGAPLDAGGMPGGDMGGGPGLQAAQTTQAAGSGQGLFPGVSPALLDAVITFLEVKVQ